MNCEHPSECTAAPEWNVMGARANDWAVNVCTEHRPWAEKVLAPTIVYPLAPPAPADPDVVRSNLTPRRTT